MVSGLPNCLPGPQAQHSATEAPTAASRLRPDQVLSQRIGTRRGRCSRSVHAEVPPSRHSPDMCTFAPPVGGLIASIASNILWRRHNTRPPQEVATDHDRLHGQEERQTTSRSSRASTKQHQHNREKENKHEHEHVLGFSMCKRRQVTRSAHLLSDTAEHICTSHTTAEDVSYTRICHFVSNVSLSIGTIEEVLARLP